MISRNHVIKDSRGFSGSLSLKSHSCKVCNPHLTQKKGEKNENTPKITVLEFLQIFKRNTESNSTRQYVFNKGGILKTFVKIR